MSTVNENKGKTAGTTEASIEEKAARKLPSHPTTQVTLIDSAHAVAATLNGVADALYYRAECEQDDMLHLLASVLQDQADMLLTL